MSRARPPLNRVVLGKLTRRELLTGLQLAGLGAAGVALTRGSAEASTVQGTCRLCVMHCGIIGTVKNGELVRIDGDPRSKTEGFLCLHGKAMPSVVHAKDRLRRPLVRKKDHFEETTWPRAIAEIADRLQAIKARHGAQAVAIETGWPLVRHPLIPFLQRFCQAFGTPNLITVASLCEASGRMGKALTAGVNFWPDVRRAKTLIVWGANPEVAAPPFATAVASMQRKNHHLIVVDPVVTDLARRAEVHLQVRPGTDGALALAMIHIVISGGLYHRDFVATQTVGFEALAAVAAEMPPARAAEITGVPEEKIVRAARLYATQGPSAIWDGLGVEHHENGVATIRAIACLQGICGFLDAPGGGQLWETPSPRFFEEPLPSAFAMTTPEPVPPAVSVKPLGYDEYPLYEVFNRQAQGNLLARAILEDQPYPIRGLILIGSNALVTSPNSTRLRHAAEKLELLVSLDPFLSASGQLADYVLPAATFAEGSLVEPAHQAWPDWKAVFELARALGLERYFPWKTFDEAMAAPRVPFMPDPAHTLQPDPPSAGAAIPRFPSKTGKVELFSATLERFGFDPLPRWKPPSTAPSDAFPLLLVSGARSQAFINSQFRGIAEVRRKMPSPIARVHPETAARAGLEDGHLARVSSPHGAIEIEIALDARIHREVVALPAGWAEANANVLTDDRALDPISGFPAYRSTVCRIEPVAASTSRPT